MGPVYVGIDVGAAWLHLVALDETASVVEHDVFAADDLEGVVGWAGGAEEIAIDSPDGWSTCPHGDDDSLSPKFRTARCAEIGLGRGHGIYVPWTTPPHRLAGSWMDAGIAQFSALRQAGHSPIECYPYAAFRRLAGSPLPAKRSPAGRVRRRQLLREAGVVGELSTWSHDSLDAAVAALVAWLRQRGGTEPATCGHDGTAIWLPTIRTEAAPGTHQT